MGTNSTTRQVGGAGKLKIGAKLGEYTVQNVTEGQLTLRGSRAFGVKAIAIGILMLLIGLCASTAVLRDGSYARHGKVFFIPIGGIIWIVLGLSRLGQTWVFDANNRVLATFGFLSHKVLQPGFFNRVRLGVLPTNLNQRETLVLDLMVSERVRYRVGRRRTNKTDAVNLMFATRQIAAMLGLPIEVAGTLQHAPQSLIEQFADLDDAGRPLYRAA